MYFQYGAEETDYLTKKDKRLGDIIARIGPVEREVDPDLFSAVVHHIIGQQISTRAQLTVWSRMRDALGTVNAETILAAGVPMLQSLGMTFRKAEYITDFAEKVRAGAFDPAAVARAGAADEVRASVPAQAVGGAVGRNPLSVFIPCHRVVGASGSLTGYAGGLDRKIALLKLERCDMTHLPRPAKGAEL